MKEKNSDNKTHKSLYFKRGDYTEVIINLVFIKKFNLLIKLESP